MHRCGTSMLFVTIALVAMAIMTSAQELLDELAIFEPLVGTFWIGRFQDHWVSQADHLIEWNAILDGRVVQWSKRVDELDFAMETFFYWDRDLETIVFTQLASNGNHGDGLVETEGRALALVGTSAQPSGPVEFRQVFEIMEDGTLEDRYFTRVGNGWAPQHVIVYGPVQEQEKE